MSDFKHQSVLLKEAIDGLNIKKNGIYIDGTFGRGGHSRAILDSLSESGKLIAIDKDSDAIEYANLHFKDDQRFSIIKSSFANIDEIAANLNITGKINGILLDLGVSSPQLDDASRGFSFLKSGPLDMRMDKEQSLSAKDFINKADVKEMTYVFKKYGEERFSARIARAIAISREKLEITSTEVLANIIKEANPKWEKHKHPATRVFQAIRIYINQELTDLMSGLKNCVKTLAVGGRLAVISFHSLEDRIVKQFMRDEEKGKEIPFNIPIKEMDLKKTFKRIGKAIKPAEIEIHENPRARSAILRIGEKIA